MENNKKNKGKIVVIGIVAAIVIVTNLLTFLITSSCNLAIGNKVLINTPSTTSAKNITKLVSLEKLLKEDYYTELDEQKLWNYAFKGLYAGTGDPYSTYYTEEEFNSYTEGFDSNYSGVGIQIMNNENSQVIVDSIFQGSPAEKSGMKAGDIITKVDDMDTTKASTSDVSKKLRGKTHTKVTVTVLRDKKEITMVITRDKIDMKRVSGKMIGDLGYIKITEFTDKVGKQFENYYNEYTNKNMKGLIIDLRDNPGGLVNEATEIANLLLKENSTIISTTNKSGKTQTVKDTTSEYAKVPIVVLINENSASSSEILSCALQDNKVATIMGVKSYGKGIIQEVKSLLDGSGVTITSDEYVSPLGHKIHKKGITPNQTVKLNSKKSLNQLSEKEDNQIQSTIKYLKQNIK